tara:strand:- start:20196 stop:22121 length:1926 start_codon:yes stop_codon:yes gene_type:complete
MKKTYIDNTIWFIAALVPATVFVWYFYSSTVLDRCYWSNIDSDFCYSVASLRFLDNYSSGFVEHTAAGEGLPVVQMLSWFYLILSKVGLLGESTFVGLTIHKDPLVHLQQYVKFGWIFGSLTYFMVVTTVFWFTRMLSRSNIASFIASLLATISWSNIQFLLRIRSEAFSACFALISLYLMFKAVKSPALRRFAFYVVASSVCLAFALFAKRNAMPYLFFIPAVLVLVPRTSLERSNNGSRSLLLRCAIIGNLIFLPPLLPLVSYWPEFVGSFSTILMFVLFGEVLGFVFIISIAIFVIFVLRARIYQTSIKDHGSLRRYAEDTLIYLLVLCIGFAVGAYISFVHPVLNRYTLFLIIMIVVAGLFTVFVKVRGQNSENVVLNSLREHVVGVRTVLLVSVLTVAWTYVWYVAYRSFVPLSTNIEIAVSRSLFEILHPQSSVSFLSYGENISMSDYLYSVYSSWLSHYRNVRWPELLVILLAISQAVRANHIMEIKQIIFLALVGMSLLFFSALRLLYPFYIIYEDIATIVTVASAFGYLINAFRYKLENKISSNISKIFSFAALLLMLIVSARRTQEMFVMQSQATSYGCISPPSGDTCMCDPYYAGSRFGGTGLKDVIERQYGLECMQAVEMRFEKGIPIR